MEAGDYKGELEGYGREPEAGPVKPVEAEVVEGCVYPTETHPDKLVFTIYHNVACIQPHGDRMADVKLMACAGCCRVWPEFKSISD